MERIRQKDGESASIGTGHWERWDAFMKEDRLKWGAQYFTALYLLEDIQGLHVLDVGCGNGVFSEAMIRRGAKVTGYDSSPDQVERAREKNENNEDFVCATPADFPVSGDFDRAVAVNVLMHAEDMQELEMLFQNTWENLKTGGEFIAVIHNPEYGRCEEVFYQRKIKKREDGKNEITFYLQDGSPAGTATITDFQKSDYEVAAQKVGFGNLRWESIQIDSEVLTRDSQFWEGFLDDCPYIAFVAEK